MFCSHNGSMVRYAYSLSATVGPYRLTGINCIDSNQICSRQRSAIIHRWLRTRSNVAICDFLVDWVEVNVPLKTKRSFRKRSFRSISWLERENLSYHNENNRSSAHTGVGHESLFCDQARHDPRFSWPDPTQWAMSVTHWPMSANEKYCKFILFATHHVGI